jgi:hypothetical protein
VLGQSPSPPKRPTMEGNSEKSLGESPGIV